MNQLIKEIAPFSLFQDIPRHCWKYLEKTVRKIK